MIEVNDDQYTFSRNEKTYAGSRFQSKVDVELVLQQSEVCLRWRCRGREFLTVSYIGTSQHPLKPIGSE